MKIGKQPKRVGPKSDKFLAQTRPELLTPPMEGPVHIYLDDERPVPEGWTIVRRSLDFFRMLDDPNIAARIEHLSLDSSLARDDTTGVLLADSLCSRFRRDSDFLPSLKSIGLHSSNRAQSVEMDRMLATGIPKDRRGSFYVQWGTPRLTKNEEPRQLKKAKSEPYVNNTLPINKNKKGFT